MSDHHLKCWPHEWDAIAYGRKRFEVRSNTDRDFAVGDVLVLYRWDPSAPCFGSNYSHGEYVNEKGETVSDMDDAAKLRVRVTYILHGGRFGLSDGVCVMSIVQEPADG